MGRYKNIYQYRAALNKRINRLKRTSRKTNRQICELISARAKRFAPKDTGATLSGIRVRKMSRGWQVESWVPGRFKQNLWANQSPGYKRLRYPRGAWIPAHKSKTGHAVQVLPPGSSAVYGRTPAGWRWSGKPGFFTWAVNKTRPTGFKMHVRNSRKAMRAY